MAMNDAERRWYGQKSSFSWEQDALDHIRAQMPEVEPYRAWQTFTFTADRGHGREVDLFIATPAGLFLVEFKERRTQRQRAAPRGLTVPRIEAAVFLSAENLRCEFDQFQRQRVYGRDRP